MHAICYQRELFAFVCPCHLLNRFCDADAEQIWKWTAQFVELDHEKKAEGCDLDEFNAHRFLEKAGAFFVPRLLGSKQH
jgi:hypothetical protein